MKYLKGIFIGISLLSISTVSAIEKNDTLPHVNLGDVTVTGVRAKKSVNMMTGDFMTGHNTQRVDEAIDLLPGITVRDAGARNEGSFYLRGFDQRRVPVFLDGVPIYVPYEGEMDMRRLQTATLAKVSVQRTMPSLLLGGNAMGGAVNLVSAVPDSPLELKANTSLLLDANSWDIGGYAGTRQDRFFASAGVSYIDRKYIRLPHSFTPIEGLQTSRHLVNSGTHDLTLNAKFGFTPNSTDQYTISYTMIRADKGVPTYLGRSGKARFWRYPKWNKDEIMFHSSTKIAEGSLESRLFYDRYYNKLKSYDDISCTTQDKESSFTSIYNDYSIGAYLGYGIRLHEKDLIRFGGNFKRDVHRAHDNDDPEARMADNFYSFAIENTLDFGKAWRLNAAAGLFGRKGTKAERYEGPADAPDNGIVDYPHTSNLDFNYQASLKWKFIKSHSAALSFARTSRFPTLDERYSFKLGKAIPNPDLTTEHSYNLDLTINGRISDFLWSVSGYYSWLTNTIMEITGVDPENPTIWQLQNKGKAQFRGFEVALSYTLLHSLTISGNYSYIDRVNTTDRSVKFTDVPHSKGVVAVDWRLKCGLSFAGDFTAYSSALSTSDGSLFVPGFAVINLNASYKLLNDMLTIRCGVRNLTDKLYYYTEGYPQAGREFYSSLQFDFTSK